MKNKTGRWQVSMLGAAAAGVALLFAAFGEAKPVSAWSFLDVAGEGGLALLAAAWAAVVLCSRPAGRVTALLGGGLAALALAAWADALDELFRVADTAAWLGWIESGLAPLGIVLLSAGLVLWRQEQFMLGEQLGPRERGLRDHRAFDRLTRLADAGYLRQQIAMEAACAEAAPCSVAMLDLPAQMEVERFHGNRTAARLLQAVCQQLLLNLGPRDLLCRYAGDRLVVLMPQTPLDDARQRAEHLRRMVEAMRFHASVDPQAPPLRATLRTTCAPAGPDAQATLTALGRAFEAASAATTGIVAA